MNATKMMKKRGVTRTHTPFTVSSIVPETSRKRKHKSFTIQFITDRRETEKQEASKQTEESGHAIDVHVSDNTKQEQNSSNARTENVNDIQSPPAKKRRIESVHEEGTLTEVQPPQQSNEAWPSLLLDDVPLRPVIANASGERKAQAKKNKKQKAKQKAKQNPPASLDQSLHKYWYQRYTLFKKYDEGIRLDDESWFSVTPEDIAAQIAEKCRCGTIVDAFCGAGGNAIQFASTCEQVIAIDIDPAKLALAKHNAAIYGVLDYITFIEGDFMELCKSTLLNYNIDAVFLSPPWGGVDYKTTGAVFDVVNMGTLNGIEIFQAAQALSKNIAYYVPRNSSPEQLQSLSEPFEITRNYIFGREKAWTVYYGELAWNDYEGVDTTTTHTYDADIIDESYIIEYE